MSPLICITKRKNQKNFNILILFKIFFIIWKVLVYNKIRLESNIANIGKKTKTFLMLQTINIGLWHMVYLSGDSIVADWTPQVI